MRAIVYTRVSSDQSGHGRSVESQEAECRAVCARYDWPVAEVLCDNDIGASRHTGKARPQYQRLAEILKPGDVLVTWEASRAQRDLEQYVKLRRLCAELGVLWSYGGKLYDLSNGDDRFGTGLDALLAEKEAEGGVWGRCGAGGRAPPYGYRRQIDPLTGKTTGWAVDEQTGPIVAEVIKRVLAGESLWSIVRDLKARGVPAPQVQRNAAKEWKPQRLRVTISSPTYAGLRSHQGQVMRDEHNQPVRGHWEPMISVEDHERLMAILRDPARRTTTHRGREPRHLLTGIARCGVCLDVMRWHGPKSLPTPRYLCAGASCVGRRADAVDALVESTLIKRLSRRDAAKLFARTVGSEQARKAAARADTLRIRLASFVEAAATGEITAATLAAIEHKLLPAIEAAEAAAKLRVPSPLVAKLAGRDAHVTWEQFSVKDRRTVVASLLSVTINRSTVGTHQFDPGDVDIVWKTRAL